MRCGLAAASPHDDLDANYARFGEKALRVALLLASVSNHPRVELRHWARAQEITERWRAGLHTAFGLVNEDEPSRAEQAEEKVADVVRRLYARKQMPTAADVAGTCGA